jgi:hypothetical protein
MLRVFIALMRGVLVPGLWPEWCGVHLEITRCWSANSCNHLCERLGIKRDKTLREQRCTMQSRMRAGKVHVRNIYKVNISWMRHTILLLDCVGIDRSLRIVVLLLLVVGGLRHGRRLHVRALPRVNRLGLPVVIAASLIAASVPLLPLILVLPLLLH